MARLAWGMTVASMALASTAVAQSLPTLPVPEPPPPASAAKSLTTATLRYGPPPAWVAVATALTSPPTSDSRAVQVLLQDQQAFLGPDADEVYRHSIVKVLDETGLQALGTFRTTWNPDTEVVTLHRLRILRDGQVIDVLDGGRNMVVLRRETNLERASLDGQLTATQQIDGLRIGDVVETEYTARRRDPALAGFSEFSSGLNSPGLTSRLRIRVIWPDGKPIRWQVSDGLPPPKVTRTVGRTELVEDLTDVRAPQPPVQSPGRYHYLARFDVTQFSSWGDIARVMAPLYAKAEALAGDSPVKTEAAKIKAQASTPELRASMALALVQGQVRYQFVGLSDGGFVPAGADETWARRFGDCKGKTVLLLALLHALGIEAEPVLVSTTMGDGLDQRLPLLYFDHVLVRAHVGKDWYWLDGTRPADPPRLANLTPPPFRWALPVRAAGADLTTIDQPAPVAPLMEDRIRLDASAGIEAAALRHEEMVVRGDTAIRLGIAAGAVGRTLMERSLRESWERANSQLQAKTVDWTYDPTAPSFTVRLDGVQRVDWNWNRDVGRRELAISAAPTFEPKKREPGQNQDAPYAVDYPAYATIHEDFILPNQGKGFAVVGGEVERTIAGIAFSQKLTLKDGVATLDVSSRSLAREYPASDAGAVLQFLRDVSDDPFALRAPTGEDAPAFANPQSAPPARAGAEGP